MDLQAAAETETEAVEAILPSPPLPLQKPKRVRRSRAKPKVTSVENIDPPFAPLAALGPTNTPDAQLAPAIETALKPTTSKPRNRAPAKPRPSRSKAAAAASAACTFPAAATAALGGAAAATATAATAAASEEKALAAAQNDQKPFSVTHPRENFVKFVMDRIDEGNLSIDQVQDIEIGVFNWSLEKAEERRIPKTWRNARFLELYTSKARSIASNLIADSYVANERLTTRIKDTEFAPHDVVGMTADRVCPERWQKVVEAKIRHDEYISTAKPTAMTDQFLCGRCKKRECSFMELQTRSCDEPASIFVCCLSCGHRWRMG